MKGDIHSRKIQSCNRKWKPQNSSRILLKCYLTGVGFTCYILAKAD